MNILIVGASGATGRLLVEDLLNRGHMVKAVLRRRDSLPAALTAHENLTLIEASLLDLSDAELAALTKGCDAVASCLGHNLTFKGVFGFPRRLVTDATRRLCDAIRANAPDTQVRFVLMNTTGNTNRDIPERVPLSQRIVTALLRLILPPHVDNEKAADHLRLKVGQNDPIIKWAAVRPDGLIDETEVSDYDIHPSPIRNPIFDAGKTSRVNVANFMASLATEDLIWKTWQGRMPVIYNQIYNQTEG
ncbi:MAG: NAD(P)-dependent oxidoreductase [Maritimibacter sp.]